MAFTESKAYAEQPRSDEQVEIDYLKQSVSRLEDLIGALCATNFLTEHMDGDEEVREHAVNRVNRQYRRYADDFKAKQEIAALEEQKREIEQKIQDVKYGTLNYKASGRYNIPAANFQHQGLSHTIATIPNPNGLITSSNLEQYVQAINNGSK